jgi:hypothetical protein
MHSFAMLLKSYAADAAYAKRLIASFHRFNSDSIHLFIVVPGVDLETFRSVIDAVSPAQAAEQITLLDEEQLGQYLVTEPVHGLRPGYINQEIVKLAFLSTLCQL